MLRLFNRKHILVVEIISCGPTKASFGRYASIGIRYGTDDSRAYTTSLGNAVKIILRRGKPLDKKSKKGAEVNKKKHPREFEIFCRIPGMIMVKVTPTYVKSWVRIDNKFFIEHLDLENKVAYLEKPNRS